MIIMGFSCFDDFVSFRSFRLFWRFRFGRFGGFVALFRGLVHAVVMNDVTVDVIETASLVLLLICDLLCASILTRVRNRYAILKIRNNNYCRVKML